MDSQSRLSLVHQIRTIAKERLVKGLDMVESVQEASTSALKVHLNL